MVEQHHTLAALREAVAVYDDDALSALANKGLLRRAYKDLETVSLTPLDAGEDGVRIDTGEAVVTLALPFQTSRCTCPASGVCRHILLALLWLQREAPAPVAAAASIAAGDEILALTEEALQRWAGKPLVRKALQRLAQGITVTWQEGQTLDFAFADRELTCRWLPGQGLEGMVCDCHAPQCCEHRAMAILAYQAARGLRDLTLEEAPSPAETRERAAALEAVEAALNGLVGHGLSHLSPAQHERVATLAISAHGADLPRLERLLKSLATEIQLQSEPRRAGGYRQSAHQRGARRGAAPGVAHPHPGVARPASQRVFRCEGSGTARHGGGALAHEKRLCRPHRLFLEFARRGVDDLERRATGQ